MSVTLENKNENDDNDDDNNKKKTTTVHILLRPTKIINKQLFPYLRADYL